VGNKTVLILGCSSDIEVQGVRIFLEKKWGQQVELDLLASI